MQTLSSRRHDNPVIEVAVYTQTILSDLVGRDSELNCVDLLAVAFDLGELNYDIHYDFALQDYQARTSLCDQPFTNWNDDVLSGNIPYVAKDNNMLLIDGRAGGCANSPDVKPGAMTVGATPLQTFSYALSDIDMGLEGNAAAAVLHEHGHTMGSESPRGVHFGYGFNDDPSSTWYRTPTVSSSGRENACGEFIESRVYQDSTVRYLFYHWCAITQFDIVGYGQPSPPSEYPPIREGETAPLADQLTQPPPETSEGGSLVLPALLLLGAVIVLSE